MDKSFSTLVRAARLPFLIITPLCLIAALALLWLQDVPVSPGDGLRILLGALLVHLAVNGFNEYFDFRSGLDLMTRRTPFSGGSGALPENPAAATAVLYMSAFSLVGAGLMGFSYLIQAGPALIALCALAAVIVVSYSPWLNQHPASCYLAPGLGFGPILMLAAILALGGEPDAKSVAISFLVALWISQLLLVNQLPDEQADRAVGRRHLVVVWGRSGAMEFSFWMLTAGLAWLLLICVAFQLVWLALAFAPALGLTLLAWYLVHHHPTSALLGLNLVLVLTCLTSLCVGLWLSV